jgi:hypothetical protein
VWMCGCVDVWMCGCVDPSIPLQALLLDDSNILEQPKGDNGF